MNLNDDCLDTMYISDHMFVDKNTYVYTTASREKLSAAHLEIV